MSPKVSILIPVYNREKLLGACIDSALTQTNSDFEIVICDNASTDGTWKVCEDYAARDKRVRIFRNEENVGPVRNWRRCLEEAQGELAKILFSDDLIYPTCLEKLTPFMDDPDVGFAFSAAQVGPTPGAGGLHGAWKSAPAIATSRQFVSDCLLTQKLLVSPGAALFRRADLQRNLLDEVPSPTLSGFWRTGAGPDLLCYLLTARDYPKVAHLLDPLSFFRDHSGSISVSSEGRLVEPYWQARLWFAENFTDANLYAQVRVGAWFALCRKQNRLLPYPDALKPFIAEIPPVSWLEKWLWLTKSIKILRRQYRRSRN